LKKGERVFCSHRCRTKEFISKEALAKMAITQIKKGERRSINTEFKKGHCVGHRFKKGAIPWNYAGRSIFCGHCGRMAKKKPSQLLRGNKGTFCSHHCANMGRGVTGYNGGKGESQRKRRQQIADLTDNYMCTLIANRYRVSRGVIPNDMIIDVREKVVALRALRKLKREVGNVEAAG
jgi:hypothetical protein